VRRAYIGFMNEHTPTALVDYPIPSSRPAWQPAAEGCWRYNTARRSRRTLGFAMLFSAGLHAALLFGFNRHAPKPKPVVHDDGITVLLAMPELKDLEEPEPQPLDNEKPVDAGISVPTLADVPSQIDLSTQFVQQIDYSSLVPQQDLTAAKTLSIPTHIARGSRIGEGMGKIFDLSELDRQPEPLVRVSPVVPALLKQAGISARVSVGFIVNAKGEVVAPYIVQSTDGRFNDAAVVAIAKWKFRAGIKNGHRVNVRMMQPLIFDVKDHD